MKYQIEIVKKCGRQYLYFEANEKDNITELSFNELRKWKSNQERIGGSLDYKWINFRQALSEKSKRFGKICFRFGKLKLWY